MNLVGVKLALRAPANEIDKISLKSWPIVELKNFISECSAIEVTTTLTSVGCSHNLEAFYICYASEK